MSTPEEHSPNTQGQNSELPVFVPTEFLEDFRRYTRSMVVELKFSLEDTGFLGGVRHYHGNCNDDVDTRRVVTVPISRGDPEHLRGLFVAVNTLHSIDHPDFPRTQELTMSAFVLDLVRNKVLRSPEAVAQNVMSRDTMWRPIKGEIGPFITSTEDGNFKVTRVNPKLITGPNHTKNVGAVTVLYDAILALKQVVGGLSGIDLVDGKTNVDEVRRKYSVQ